MLTAPSSRRPPRRVTHANKRSRPGHAGYAEAVDEVSHRSIVQVLIRGVDLVARARNDPTAAEYARCHLDFASRGAVRRRGRRLIV